YGLYPAIEMAGISPDFFLKARQPLQVWIHQFFFPFDYRSSSRHKFSGPLLFASRERQRSTFYIIFGYLS
ncbi:MAG: hypothetical protein ACE14P_10590, partial [Methanotrichaceae archaeon]